MTATALVNGRVAPAQLDAIIDVCDPSLALFVGTQAEATTHAARRHATAAPLTALDGVLAERRDARPELPAARPEDDVAAMICTIAPGRATFRTAIRSFK